MVRNPRAGRALLPRRGDLARGPARPRVIVLNGGSSAGKSSLVRALQVALPEPWIAFGVDSLVEAMPPHMLEGQDGLAIAADGSVAVGPAYRAIAARMGAVSRADWSPRRLSFLRPSSLDRPARRNVPR